MKKFLTIAALTTAVLMSGAACSSSEDAATTTTTKADAASTTVAADSGSDATSTGDPDVDELCAAAKSAAKEIAENPEQIQQIGDNYQAQIKDLATKLSDKYSVSNPPSPEVAQAMGECLQDALSVTTGITMPSDGN